MTRRESFSPFLASGLDFKLRRTPRVGGEAAEQQQQINARHGLQISGPSAANSESIRDHVDISAIRAIPNGKKSGLSGGFVKEKEEELKAATVKRDYMDSSMPIISFPKLPPVARRNADLKGKQSDTQLLRREVTTEVSKEQKTVRIESTDLEGASQKVITTIAKEKEAGFSGTILFNVRGISASDDLERFTTKIKEIISENGYTPKSKPNHPNMVFFRMVKLVVIPKQRDSETSTETTKRISVRLSTISPEKATALVRMQLKLDFPGIIEFIPETGKYNEVLMQNFPETIHSICRSAGYIARICDHQIVECWKDSRRSSDVDHVTIRLPSFDAETAENLIKKQLGSKFRGIVHFEPEKRFFSRSQMRNYPRRIIDLCSEYGYKARIVDEITNSVECEMLSSVDIPEVVSLSPDRVDTALAVMSKYIDKRRRIQFKPMHGKFSQIVETAIMDALAVAGIRYTKTDEGMILCCGAGKSRQKIIVNVSGLDKVVAENLIRTHLESSYEGKIVFKPANEKYNKSMMPEYPAHIVTICREYGFDARVIDKECVTCNKRNDRKPRKVVRISNSDPETAVLAEIASGNHGIVRFVTDSEGKAAEIMQICRKYGFEAKLKSDSEFDVQCNISPLFVNIPSSCDQTSMQTIIKKHLSTEGKTVYAFKAEGDIVSDEFTALVIDICRKCGYSPIRAGSLVICSTSRSTTTHKTISEPLVIYLPTYDADTAESLVRTQLERAFSGVVRFTPKSYKYSESVMPGWPGRILEILEEFGHRGRLVDAITQVVECVI